uniref:SH2 domain-containing protein n=1 Tax=Hucho hucho TaxID=62062 RepID=A0A4W5LF57_9TELE
MCVLQGYSRELFQFEGDRFDNIPALVRFHVGGRHPVSQASGAVVYHPITRSLPLRVISERQAERSDSNRSSNRSSNSALDRVGVESQPDRSKRLSFNSSHMDTLHVTNTLLRWLYTHTHTHTHTHHTENYTLKDTVLYCVWYS